MGSPLNPQNMEWSLSQVMDRGYDYVVKFDEELQKGIKKLKFRK